MNIIQEKWRFLAATTEAVPKQIAHRYRFGLQTLTTQGITSLRSNARRIPLNWNTAKSKIYRLSRTHKLVSVFTSLLVTLRIVTEKDFVSVDFSDFGNGFQVLMFAKQTERGRATPLYFEVLRYPIEKGSQNLFVIAVVRHLTDIVGFKPKLVFDRGFAAPTIIKFLATNKYIFYQRIKKGKAVTVEETGRRIIVRDCIQNDVRIRAYGHSLRLVVSDRPASGDEPWYLVTNDRRSSRKKVIGIYYHRFEIEEFFRDAKRLLGLEYLNWKTATSLVITLWFTILSTWFFWHVDGLLDQNDERSRKTMRLSVIRYCFERLQQAIVVASEARYMDAFGCGVGP